VTSRGAAVRYARALFDITRAEGKDLAETDRELTAFARLVTTNDALARVLVNPAIPAPRKRAVVEKLLERVGKIQPPVAKLVLLLADRDRLAFLPDVAQAFESRLMDHQGIVRAEVVTAIDLPPDRVTALKQSLARATGREVQLATRIDSRIIGGAVARIGSVVFDGSVTRQLERMRETLTNASDS
jgi:F-type H+-transporting ATPase subunit delta